jgi:hypothetical protein
MAVIIRHNKVATYPDQPDAEINKAEWNDDHYVEGAVPYTGATANVDLGTFDLITDTITSDSSAGLILENASGGDVLHIGNGGGVNATAYGGWNFDGATANTIASFGASKTLTSLATATYPSLTELSYVKGVTSAIQTQLNSKGTGTIDGTLTATRVPFAFDSNTLEDDAGFHFNKTTKLLTLTGETFTIANVTACAISIDYGFAGDYYNQGYSTQGRVYAYKDTAYGRVYSSSYFETSIVTDNNNDDSSYGVVFTITAVSGADGYHIQVQSDYDGTTFPDYFITTASTSYTYAGNTYDYGTLPTPAVRYGDGLNILGNIDAVDADFTTLDVSGAATIGGNLALSGSATVTGSVSAASIVSSGAVNGTTASFSTSLSTPSATITAGTITTLNSTTGTIATLSSTTLTATTATLGSNTYNSSGINFTQATDITVSSGGFNITHRGSASPDISVNGASAGTPGQFRFIGGAGAASTGAGALANSAGVGGTMSLQSGIGGNASGSTLTNTAGNGGAVFLTGQNGGVASGSACVTNQSGTGAGVFTTAGAGGNATTAGAQNNTAGAGGGASFTAGSGGNASNGSVTNTAGRGGDFGFTAGNAGTATGTGAAGNSGGVLTFTGGNGSVNGNGGIISFLGGAGAGSGVAGDVLLNISSGGTQRGKTGVNVSASLTAQLNVESTTEQLRLRYNNTNYYSVTVGSTGGVTFDAAGSGAGFTFSDSVALGSNNLTMTGSLGTTGARLTKGWFADLEVTNAIAGSVTGNAGTVTNGVYTTRTISTTAPLSGGGDLSANRTLSIADAAADGTTKGAATFTASDFNATTGVISIDYTNGQAASAGTKGFLTSADWSTFNAKQPAITFGTGVQSALGVNIDSAGAPVLFNGALGTPSSGALTNCSGLPVSGITSSTSTALGVGSIELGNASDTTLTRVSAGVVAIEGVNIITTANISDTAFAASWDGDTTTAPSKNAVYDMMGGTKVVAVTSLALNQSTAANTTPIALTGMSFTYEANATYHIQIIGAVSSAAATTGYGFNLDLSSAITSIYLTGFSQLANTGTVVAFSQIADAANTGVTTGVPTLNTAVPVSANGILITTSNTGTAQLQYRSETTAITTCLAGTTMIVKRIK